MRNKQFVFSFLGLAMMGGLAVTDAPKLLAMEDQTATEYAQDSKEAAAVGGATPKPDSGDEREASDLVLKCQRLCEEITKAYKAREGGSKATIAVLDFSDLSAGVTDFGRLLAEELTTNLFKTGNYKVIERRLLDKVMADNKLKAQGFIAPETARELGRILGADVVVSGTVADLDKAYRVNARVLSTKDGEVLAVAAATFVKDDSINALIANSPRLPRPVSATTTPAGRNNQGVIQFPFREDFSDYQPDDVTRWGKNAKVRIGADGRKWLVPSAEGPNPIGLDVELPTNFNIQFDYELQGLQQRPRRGGRSSGPSGLRSGLCLIDKAGAKYRVEWEIKRDSSRWRHSMTLPGGDPTILGNNEEGTVRIAKKGDGVELSMGGRVLDGDVSKFQEFTRFEVDLYKLANDKLCVTNIKVVGSDERDSPAGPGRRARPRKP